MESRIRSRPLSMFRSQQAEESYPDLIGMKRELERAQRERDKANLDWDQAVLDRDQAKLERDQASLDRDKAILDWYLLRAKKGARAETTRKCGEL